MAKPAPVVVAYTTAYPDAAGILPPSIPLSITDSIHHHFSTLSSPPSPLTLLPFPRVSAVFSSLPQPASVAVVPIENSESGSFRSVYEAIVHTGCYIVGEFAVASPVPSPSPLPPSSSSPSPPSSPPATLWTRFVLLSLTPASLPSPLSSFGPTRAPLKASAVLGLSHEAGSVFRILSCFALRNLNVLKFEMRAATPSSFLSPHHSPFVSLPSPPSHSDPSIPSSPSPPTSAPTSPRAASSPFLSSHGDGVSWSYFFLLDWIPSSDERVNAALVASLKEFSVRMVELGTYRAHLKVGDDEGERVLAC